MTVPLWVPLVNTKAINRTPIELQIHKHYVGAGLAINYAYHR